MRSYFVAFLFCFISPIANAEVFRLTKPMVCNDLESAAKEIMEDYQEKVYWVGNHRASQSNYVLLVNAKTQSWTLMQTQGNIGCIIGTGDANQMLLGMPTTN